MTTMMKVEVSGVFKKITNGGRNPLADEMTMKNPVRMGDRTKAKMITIRRNQTDG